MENGKRKNEKDLRHFLASAAEAFARFLAWRTPFALNWRGGAGTLRVAMKRLAIILLCLTPWFAGWAAATPPNVLSKLERFQLFGNEYVKLSDWADAAQFDLKWTRRDEEITVTSRWSKMVFTVDSAKATLNGIQLTLSFPIARKGSDAYVTPLDLKTAILPVLYPAKNPPGQKIETVALDPGHGGKDPGYQQGREQEKKQTLLLAQEVQQMLKDAGVKAVLTRSNDVYIDPNERPDVAKRLGADLFVSLHFNYAPGDAHGVETYCMTPAKASSSNSHGEGADTGSRDGNKNDEKNMLLAYQLQKSIVKSTGIDDRGVKRARFAVLKNSDIPAVLIENGFLSDPSELKRIVDPDYRRQHARAIVDGILAYKKLVER